MPSSSPPTTAAAPVFGVFGVLSPVSSAVVGARPLDRDFLPPGVAPRASWPVRTGGIDFSSGRHLQHHRADALLADALRHHRYLAGARSARSVPAACCGWLSTLTAPFGCSLFAALPLRHLRHHHVGALLAGGLRHHRYLAGARSARLLRPHAVAGAAR
jgi:hypothetical protein